MSHDETLVAIGAAHGVCAGGFMTVARFGAVASFACVVGADVVPVSPTIVVVEELADSWSVAMIAAIVVVALRVVVAAVVIIVGVGSGVVHQGGKLALESRDVGAGGIKLLVGLSELLSECTVGARQVGDGTAIRFGCSG